MLKQQSEQGLVAILDALGAANYSPAEIARFLKSRELVLQLLTEKAEAIVGEIKRDRLTTFTFNDTVLLVYRTKAAPTLREVRAFCTLLRKFAIDSLVHRILFRGAVAIGAFYINDATNTVLGPAVTDAAAWYNRADWIGIHATPHATMLIQALVEGNRAALDYLVVEYAVPLKGVPSTLRLAAINWPKAFFVSTLTPCSDGEQPRPKCLALLAQHQVPSGTESKYMNAMAFFDHVVTSQINKAKKR